MKRFRFTTLFLLTLLFCDISFAYDFEVDGIYYGYDTETQSVYVTSGEKKYSGKIVIPQSVSYNGKTLNVSAVGAFAFKECEDLISVDIPQSITDLGGGAFMGCQSLTTVNIPENITIVNGQTFRNCTNLTSINLPTQITSIGGNAFDGCVKLEYIKLPNSLVEIRGEAFKDCKCLKSISIPGSVNRLFYKAFENCIGLKTIILEDSENGLICDGQDIFYKYDAFWGTAPERIYIGRSIPEMLFWGVGGNEHFIFDKITTIGIGRNVKSASISNLHLWTSLEKIYSLSNNPEPIGITFGTKTLTNAKLYIPTGTKDKYLTIEDWKHFFQIEEMDIDKMWNGVDEAGNNDNSRKCEVPTISYSNGKLLFNCTTEGAICKSTITDSDIKSYSSNEVILNVTYDINVYATKEGYENSDIAMATLCWIDVEPKAEGITNNDIASVRAQAVLIQAEDGFINVDGVDEGINIIVYSSNGIIVGSGKSHKGKTIISTNLPTGSIAIVKIGERSIKVIIK